MKKLLLLLVCSMSLWALPAASLAVEPVFDLISFAGFKGVDKSAMVQVSGLVNGKLLKTTFVAKNKGKSSNAAVAFSNLSGVTLIDGSVVFHEDGIWLNFEGPVLFPTKNRFLGKVPGFGAVRLSGDVTFDPFTQTFSGSGRVVRFDGMVDFKGVLKSSADRAVIKAFVEPFSANILVFSNGSSVSPPETATLKIILPAIQMASDEPLNLTVATTTESGPASVFPEKDGIYDVPGRPDLKVRVIVHYPKLNSPSSPVCNQPDPDSGAVVQGGRWHLPLGTWTYQLNIKSVPGPVGKLNFPIFAAQAFNKWSEVLGGKFNFVRGPDTEITQANADDGINMIAWGNVPAGALAVSYATFRDDGTITNSDIIFSKNYSWSWTPFSLDTCCKSKAYDAQDVLTHELGHWLGLKDEYDPVYDDNTMYGSASLAEIKKDTLTQGDILGVQAIYP